MDENEGVHVAPEASESRAYRLFFAGLTLAVLLLVATGVGMLVTHNRAQLERESLSRAQAHFRQIVLTRRWNAQHGGVYVEKRGDMQSNPYLDDPDVQTVDGRTLTLKNPALMVREISEIARTAGLFQFHITSRNPINPDNKPDAWEADTLERFAAGASERGEILVDDRGGRFRYMGALKVVESCLPCHRKEDYKVGDVRGGISLEFPIEPELRRNLEANWVVGGAAAAGAVGLLGVMYLLLAGLIRRLDATRTQLRRLATTDFLTGAHNRGTFTRRLEAELARSRRGTSPLAVLMIDIDHFKQVNDKFGHAGGDHVLQVAVQRFGTVLRPYDALGRLGGEEFAVVLPGVEAGGARAVAERLRAAIANRPVRHEGRDMRVTISVGVATHRPGETVDDLLRRADEAMYEAKESGRNAVRDGETGLPTPGPAR